MCMRMTLKKNNFSCVLVLPNLSCGHLECPTNNMVPRLFVCETERGIPITEGRKDIPSLKALQKYYSGHFSDGAKEEHPFFEVSGA